MQIPQVDPQYFRNIIEVLWRSPEDDETGKIDQILYNHSLVPHKSPPQNWPQVKDLAKCLRSRSLEEYFTSGWLKLKPMARQGGRTWYPYIQILVSKDKNAIEGILSLRVLLATLLDQENERDKLASIGMRFEMPQAPEQSKQKESEAGAHDYFHMQLSTSASASETKPYPGIPPWFPESEPAIPVVRPTNGVEYLLTVLLSLYGMKKLASELRKQKQLHERFKKYRERKEISIAADTRPK